eukprot:scaffold21010_cov25-Phaeocystis_antarctica.AAC.2
MLGGGSAAERVERAWPDLAICTAQDCPADRQKDRQKHTQRAASVGCCATHLRRHNSAPWQHHTARPTRTTRAHTVPSSLLSEQQQPGAAAPAQQLLLLSPAAAPPPPPGCRRWL